MAVCATERFKKVKAHYPSLNIIFSGLKRTDVSQFERSVDERIVEAPDETLAIQV